MKPVHSLILVLILTCAPVLQSETISPAAPPGEAGATRDTEGNYQRARELARGVEMPRDLKESYRLMMEAAEEGHPEATGAIGLFHQHGWAGLEKNDEKAVEWYKKGYELGGVRAGSNYGVMLVNGLGVEQDETKGLSLIEAASDAGVPEARLVLGSYFFFGKHGKEVDHGKALGLFEQAAEAGNPHAQNMMGVMFEHGMGTMPDTDKAANWYRKAAEANIKKAQASLAMILGPASKDPERRQEALKWLFVAVKNNEITAIKHLNGIRLTSDAEELGRAREEAEKFRIKMLQLGRLPE